MNSVAKRAGVSDIKIQKIRNRQIDFISLKLDSGIILSCKNIQYKIENRRLQLEVDQLALKKTSVSQKSADIDVDQIIKWAGSLRFFVSKIKIKNANFESKNIKDIEYISQDNKDTLIAKIDNSPEINLAVNWNGSSCENVQAKCKNIFGFSAFLNVDFLKNDEHVFKLEARNPKSDIIANIDGNLSNSLKLIDMKNVFIQHGEHSFNFSGKFYPDTMTADWYYEVMPEKFLEKFDIPQQVSQNFQSVVANAHIHSCFEKSKHDFSIVFEREKTKLGRLIGCLDKKVLNASGDISWIDSFGFQFKTLDLHSANLKDIKLHSTGEGFEIKLHGNLDKKISVHDFSLTTADGIISAENPFVLDFDNLNCAFNFDMKSLKVLKHFLRIKGQTSGKLSVKNNLINIDAKFPTLFFKDFEIYDGKVIGNLEDLNLNIRSLKCEGFFINNIALKKTKDKLNLDARLNDKTTMSLKGVLNQKKVSFNGVVRNKKNHLDLNSCSIDLDKNIYKIAALIASNKEQGNLDFYVADDKYNIKLKNFSLKILGGFLDKKIPCGTVNGTFNATERNGVLIGDGHFTLDGLLAADNKLNFNVRHRAQEFSLEANLKNKQDDLSIKAVLPMQLQKNRIWHVTEDSPINISIIGGINIANLFNFSDDYSVKVNAKSNLHIRGTFRSPKITGNIDCVLARILVQGIILKNGSLNLKGNGANKLVVTEAGFKDSFKHTAKITGDASLVFNEFIPNLDVNLNLDFNNFRLFDADDLKLNVSGKGTMSGPIYQLKLAGDLTVPFCEFKYSGDDENTYSDIVVMNDPYLRKHKNKSDGFFHYDVHLNCPKIDLPGDIYDLCFAGNLDLGNYEHNPTLSGKLHLKEGKLNLLGKRMIFSSGTVEFLPQYPFDPKVKLSCFRNIDAMRVILDIKNSPEKGGSIDLHSQPMYSIDMILSHLMFNKGTENLSVGEAAQLVNAVNNLKQNNGIFSILNMFQNIGIVDTISFSGDEKTSSINKDLQTSSNNSVNIKAGKYISDNVFISVNKKEEQTSFDVEISLDSNTSLKANSQGEVGVSWKYRY